MNVMDYLDALEKAFPETFPSMEIGFNAFKEPVMTIRLIRNSKPSINYQTTMLERKYNFDYSGYIEYIDVKFDRCVKELREFLRKEEEKERAIP